MPKRPSPHPTGPTPLSSWDVYRAAHKATWLATVEAADERGAMERNLPANKLIAMRQR